MRKSKQHTVSRFNYPAFMPQQNIFANGGWEDLANADRQQNPWNYADDLGSTVDQYKNSTNWLGISKANNPFSKGNIGGTMKAAGTAALGAVAAPVGDMIGKGISGGLQSGAGNAISNIGGTIGTGLMAVNPILGAGVTIGSKVLGGLTNAAFGMKTNQAALNAANNAISQNQSFVSNASSFDGITGPTSTANFTNPYKGGWFKKGKARRKNAALKQQFLDAKSFANRSVDNNISNISDDQMNNALANYAAFGGPLNTMPNDGMGAIGYGLMSDYLTMKNNQAQAKNTVNNPYFSNFGMGNDTLFADGGNIHIDPSKKGTFTAAATKHGMGVQEFASHVLANPDDYSPLMRKKANFARNFGKHKKSDGGNLFIGNNGDTLFALGGDMQTNGGDYSTGLTHVSAGGTHSENPYGGVQMGIAPDNSPNLVEENETIFDDYVFSNRIKPTKEVLKKFHMYSKGGKLSYADVSKKLEKEAEERPNDALSRASLHKMLQQLADAQEEQKAEEEAKRARQAFEALSPEEQAAVMQQIAAQQNGGESGVENGGEEVPVDENGNPIDASAMQQPTQPQEEVPQEEGVVGAYGGNLHKYPDGGTMQERIWNAMNLHTLSDWNKWAAENDIDDVDWNTFDWDNIAKNQVFMDVLAKSKPALANAISQGYDFGTFTPNTNGYDLDAYSKVISGYTPSKTRGNTKGNYKIDSNFIKNYYDGKYADIAALEASKPYQDYSNALVNVANAAKGLKFNLSNGVLENVNGQTYTPENLSLLNTLYNTAQGTSTATDGKPVPLFIQNGDGTYSIADNAQELLVGTDGKGGLRYDGKGGIFHLTPNAVSRNSTTNNFVINDDGTIEAITGDVPTDWAKDSTYSWANADSDFTNNYYKRPTAAANPEDAGEGGKGNDNKLETKDEGWRYAGLLGPAVGLGLWSMGVGKPDTSSLDAALQSAGQAYLADYKPIGNYMRYTPFDVWSEQNRLQANARATDRAILNNSSPVGTKYAGLLANAYNNQLADANLHRQADESNFEKYAKVSDFNRGTDIQNANAYNQTSQFNADARNKNRQYRASLAADIARQKMAADAEWYNGLYGNLGELFKGISNIGKDNMSWNQVAGLYNVDALGRYNKKDARAIGGQRSAKGGKLKKRKGLTF